MQLLNPNIILNGQGAGLYSSSTAKIINATFSEQQATSGAAIFASTGNVEIADVIFKNNAATTNGGAINSASVLQLNRTSFINNTAQQHGGAMYTSGTNIINNSIFSRNAILNAGAYYGAALYVYSGTSTLSNISFSQNTMAYIHTNKTLSYGAAIYRRSGVVNLFNSILWGNHRGAGVADQLNVGINANYNIIEGNYVTGTEIKFGDPMFSDPSQDDLRLKNGSLAVDAGLNNHQSFQTDILGEARIVNETIDLGAYENEGGGRMTILPAQLGPFGRGTLVDLPLTAEGSTLPLTWTFQGGQLPIGLSFSETGLLSGTPTVVGSYTFVLGVSDGAMAGNRQFTVTVTAGPARLFVKQGATGANNGNDWANAFTDLQPALAQAKATDEIWVAKGSYSAGLLAKSSFVLIEGVKIYGGFAGTEMEIEERDSTLIRTQNETILDGSKGVASYHVVFNSNTALSNATVLDGFSIQGGKTASIYSSYVYYNANYLGGGIYNSGGSGVFKNLWIKNNTATYGGGLYHNGNASYHNILFSNNIVKGTGSRGGAVYSASGLVLDKVEFENNGSKESASYPSAGAAIYGLGVSQISNASFTNNSLLNGQGGAIFTTGTLHLSQVKFTNNKATSGGAMQLSGGISNLTDVEFLNNSALANGGAINNTGATLNINRAQFLNNSSVQNGGAIYTNAAMTIKNAVFAKNKTTSTGSYYGGAIFVYSGVTTITHSTIADNSIAYNNSSKLSYGGGIYRRSGTVTVNNSILYQNKRAGAVADQLNASIKVQHAIVQNGFATGSQIIDADPAFSGALNNEYQLAGNSPAINMGDNNLSTDTLDLARSPRLLGQIVDLGAYEYQGAALIINPTTIPVGYRGVAYQQQLSVAGDLANATYKIITGKLPDGLFLSPDGLIKGSPIVNGTYVFGVSASNGTLSGNRFYTLEIGKGSGIVKILVSQSATAGENNGSSWANAYLSLQRALEVSQVGDQIWVAKGNYSPGDLITSTFTLKEGVKIYGGFAGTEENLNERDSLKIRTENQTILKGNNINRHLVYNKLALTNATELNGFTITEGKGAVSNSEHGFGSGIYNSKGNAIFRNLWIKNNHAYGYGGGMFNGGTSLIENVRFESNSSTIGAYNHGGGLYNSGANIINNVEFINNTAGRYGGGLYVTGNAKLNNVTFNNNTSGQHGAGIYFYSGTIHIKNAAFSRNKVTTAGGYYGGAYYQYAGTSHLTQVSMHGNSISFVNATVAKKFGGAIYKNSGTLNLKNSIVWNNNRGNAVVDELSAGIIASHVLVREGYALGKIVVDQDPVFNLSTADDLSLSSCSPAINMGNNDFATDLNKDLVGADRVKATIIDLGAYENQQERILVGPAILPEMLRGQNYQQQLAAEGGAGNYTYAVSYGKLPDGLLLSKEGLLKGKPILMGTYTFNVTASDGNLCGNYLYTIQVKPGNGGARLYVNQAATTGMNNGADWANGYLDLQMALSNSLAGDSVFVAKGNYSTGLLATSFFTLKEGVKMYGGFAGTEEQLQQRDSLLLKTTNETILNANQKSYHVLYNKLALTSATVVDGFTLTGGKTASGRSSEAYIGAGIYNVNGKAIYKNLWIKNNLAYNYGAGIYNTGAATFEQITLENNSLTVGSSGMGGAIYNSGAATFNHLTFINNKAGYGAGLYQITATANLSHVNFSGNTALLNGGAIYIKSGKLNIVNAQFLDNTAARQGGAYYQAAGSTTLTNAVFSKNSVSATSAYYGGAYYHYNGTTLINNATFRHNKMGYANAVKTNQYGAALSKYAGSVTVNNSIFWENTRGNNLPDQLSSGITIAQSDVQGGYKTGTKLVDVDPLFTLATTHDLSLSPCSPLINLGDNSKVGAVTTDIVGASRINHTTVDLGAYEYQGVYLANEAQQLPEALQWTSYAHPITVGENTSYTYALVLGQLPDGLLLQSDGMLKGEPSVAGDYEFTVSVKGNDICGSLPIKLSVKTQAPYIIEVLNPYPLPLSKYTGTPFNELELVTEVEVILSDQSKAKMPITWIEGTYNKDSVGLYNIKGVLTVASPEINRDSLGAEIKVAVVDPIYPYIVALAKLDSVKVLSGKTFADLVTQLPKQVLATYDTGTTENLNIEWKVGHYTGNPGVYRMLGTLILTEEHANPAEFEAFIDVYAQRDIVKVDPLADITVDLNTAADALILPNTIHATYHDQTAGILQVLWDNSTYISNKGGEYFLKGNIVLTDLVSNSQAIAAEIKVIIRKNIVSVAQLPAQNTAYATEFDRVELPETVEVTFDDATVDSVGVEWQKGNYNEFIAGEYNLLGDLLFDSSVDNKNNLQANLVLTVLPKPLNIVTIIQADTLKVPFGTALTDISALQNKLNVTYDNGTNGELAVEWEMDDYEAEQTGTSSYLGTPILIDGVTNTNDLRATLYIEVLNKSLIALENPLQISVKYGTEIDEISFPDSVNVTYNNQTTGVEGLIFSSETYSPLVEGVYDFIGELALSEEISNPNQLKALLKVVVGPAPFQITQIQQDSILIPFNTPFVEAQPLLTTSVMATLNNGDTRAIPVVWAADNYVADQSGEIFLAGALTLPDDVVNPNDLPSALKLIIGNRIIVSVQNTDTIAVAYGTKFSEINKANPLQVTFNDAGVEEMNILWDGSQYKEDVPATYLVKGTIQNPDDVDNPTPVMAALNITVGERVKNIIRIKTDSLLVAYGTALNDIPFPIQARAVLDDQSEIELAIKAGSLSSETYQAFQKGEYLFEGDFDLPTGVENADNLSLFTLVKVENKFITALQNPDLITVANGTLFDDLTLPDAVAVTYNDSSKNNITVQWEADAYNGLVAGIYVIKGKIDVDEDFDNPNQLQPEIRVEVLEPVKYIVQLKTDTTSVAFGTVNLVFPNQVRAVYNDNTEGDLEASNFTNLNFDSKVAGIYTFTGDLNLPSAIQNPDDLKPTFNVQVENKFVIAVKAPDTITVQFGTAFDLIPLPTQVAVTYNDQSLGELEVNWEAGNYNDQLAGLVSLNGSLIETFNQENKDQIQANIQVVVLPKLLEIDAVTAPSTLTLPYGSSLSTIIAALGNVVPVTYKDSSTGNAQVEWLSTNFQELKSGDFDFIGVLTPDAAAANPDDVEAHVLVTITKKNVVAILQPAPITDVYGKSFADVFWPEKVLVTFNDQSQEEVLVKWNALNYNPNTFAVQNVDGVLELSDGLSNTENLIPTISLTLLKNIQSVAKIPAIEVIYGTPFAELVLPQAVEVTYTDGSLESLALNWTASDYADFNLGEHTLYAPLTLSPNTLNTDSLKAEIGINLIKATQTINFAAVGNLVYGQAPILLQANASSALPITYQVVSGKVLLQQDSLQISGVGTVVIKAIQAGNDYFKPVDTTQTFNIEKAKLSVAADSLMRMFVEENPILSYKISGFVYEEQEANLRADGNLAGQPLLQTTATNQSAVGSYPIVVELGNLTATNYDFEFLEATLTITQNEHLIKFVSNGGLDIADKTIEHGQLLNPIESTRPGYSWYAWYTDQDLSMAYNFDAPVLSNLTLYADWKLDPFPLDGPISLLKVADYMVAIGELSTEERAKPVGLKLLAEKSHLADKTGPIKLSLWRGYAPLKKALVKTKPILLNGTVVTTGALINADTDAVLTERGVCYSTSPFPTVNDEIQIGSGSNFEVILNNLSSGQTYYLKAYTISALGISYGNELKITIP